MRSSPIRRAAVISGLCLCAAVGGWQAYARTTTATLRVEFDSRPLEGGEWLCGLSFEAFNREIDPGRQETFHVFGTFGLHLQAGRQIGVLAFVRLRQIERGGELMKVTAPISAAWLRSQSGRDLESGIVANVVYLLVAHDLRGRLVEFEADDKFFEVMREAIATRRISIVYQPTDVRLQGAILDLEVVGEDSNRQPIRSRKEIDRLEACLDEVRGRQR